MIEEKKESIEQKSTYKDKRGRIIVRNLPFTVKEEKLKEFLKIAANVVIIGEQKKFLSALITLKFDPQGKILPDAQLYFNAIAKDLKTNEDCMKSKKVHDAIQAAIDQTNKFAVSRAWEIRHWTLLKDDFTIDSGEFTPTMKLKRSFVAKKFEKEIEKMYLEAKL